MVRKLNESSFDGRKIKSDIQSMVDSGKNAYDIFDYLENLGFVEGQSMVFKQPSGNGTEISEYWDEVNIDDMKPGHLSIAITYLPRDKGLEVLSFRVLECKDDLSLKPVGESKRKSTSKRKMRESFDDWSEEEQLSKINFALNLLIEAWDDCNDLLLDARIDGDLLEDIIAEDYPFDRSLEEMDIDVSNWLDDCITRTVYRQSKFPD